MHPRRLAVPVLMIGAALVVGCKGEPVAATTPNALTSERRADLAMQLVDAAGTSDGAAGAGLAAAVIMSGAQPTKITASRTGFKSVARVDDPSIAASVGGTTVEGAVYNVIAFQVVERAYGDTTMGIVAWNVTSDNNPTSFVVAYEFGEGTGRFDDANGGPTAYGFVYNAPSSSWTVTSGSASLLGRTVGDACEGFAYPGLTATCNLATFTGALTISASTPMDTPNNTATGSPTFAIASGVLNGITIDVTSSTSATFSRR